MSVNGISPPVPGEEFVKSNPSTATCKSQILSNVACSRHTAGLLPTTSGKGEEHDHMGRD
ncbi:hypothetical protein PAAG_11519 [Paracoccidioides lutzii Pb01]|uniref:Uncharacterized protein n=1 Tax=Paracoccidioides lutzii (strain ATCC MYA-826 / Pb01) TaxID=502779 RepID=A0A0A2VLR6_PARBA|nr:hypothetical protein PAAG_11519 [Paracoccidioides lutzii Pb01]KGQ01794.1 hypothetical protein PAAG_11519 [Paracoccidioides lutzii Pb01]